MENKECLISVEGSNYVIFTVDCPHCLEHFSSLNNEMFFQEQIGTTEPDFNGKYKVVCPICKKEYLINGFLGG